MATVNTAELISISEANRVGVSGLVREAEHGRRRVILRNNKPVAAVVGMDQLEQLERLEQLQQDLTDMSLVAARMLTDNGNRRSLDEVLEQFGYTREQLRSMPE